VIFEGLIQPALQGLPGLIRFIKPESHALHAWLSGEQICFGNAAETSLFI
jgi:hypothetical protein